MCKLNDSILVSYYNGKDIKRTKVLDKATGDFVELIKDLSFSFNIDDAVAELQATKSRLQYIAGYKLAFKKYKEVNYDISKVKTNRKAIEKDYIYEINNKDIKEAESEVYKYLNKIEGQKHLDIEVAALGMVIEESREFFIKGFKDGLNNIKALFETVA